MRNTATCLPVCVFANFVVYARLWRVWHVRMVGTMCWQMAISFTKWIYGNRFTSTACAAMYLTVAVIRVSSKLE